jgi:hypothetical protein
MLSQLLLLAVMVASQAGPITDGKGLVRAMHDRYAAKWYKTLTFTQTTTRYDADGTAHAETWYEAIEVPSKLRIDFDPVAKGSGYQFVGDVLNIFEDGKLKSSNPFVHPLLLLGFDVYLLPPDESINKVTKLGYDLSIIREDTWQGRPVYVVGAKAGDMQSPQFWIDKQELYFVRSVGPAGRDKTKTSETQFNKYQKAGGGWIAAEVLFLVDGKRATLEEYYDVKVNPKLDEKLFEKDRWTEVHLH